MAKKGTPKKAAKPKAPKAKDRKTVSGDTSLIVRFLAPRHEKVLEDFRKAGMNRPKTTSGAINMILDQYGKLVSDVDELTKDRDQWELACRAYVAATNDGASSMKKEEEALARLLQLTKKKPGTSRQSFQRSILDGY